jgi:hypothetical protein
MLIDHRKGIDTENIPSKTLKREEEFLHGIYVALPKQKRDAVNRAPCIPEDI